MDYIQLHIGSDEEVFPTESSFIKRSYDFFRNIHDESMDNPWWLCSDISAWLCSDISATISLRRLIKWVLHLILFTIWFVISVLGSAFFFIMVVLLVISVYDLMGIDGSVIFWLLFLVTLTTIFVLKRKGRCPGHCNFLVKLCNILHRFSEFTSVFPLLLFLFISQFFCTREQRDLP